MGGAHWLIRYYDYHPYVHLYLETLGVGFFDTFLSEIVILSFVYVSYVFSHKKETPQG